MAHLAVQHPDVALQSVLTTRYCIPQTVQLKCFLLLNTVVNVSNPKQPSCKIKSAALKKAMVKKDVKLNPRWWPRNGCDGRLMVKNLITTIQVNLVPLGLGPKFT